MLSVLYQWERMGKGEYEHMNKHILTKFLYCLAVIFGLSFIGFPVWGQETVPKWEHVVGKAKKATVGILKEGSTSETEEERGMPVRIRGSGIHIGEGIILTARHAVERSEGGKVRVPKIIHIVTDELQELKATRLGANAYLDVAVYQLLPSDGLWPKAHVTLSDLEANLGEEVFTVGYPLGWGPAISFGRVGNPNTFLRTVNSRLVQIDLSACSGNSGGGVFNRQGQLMGLVHAIIQTDSKQEHSRCSRFAFSLPGKLVQRVVTAVVAGKVPGFSVLGIHLMTLRTDNRWALAVAKATGPSRHAGFRKGDILMTIDAVPITTPAQLKNYLIEQTQPGQKVMIQIKRGQMTKNIPVVLGRS